MFSLEGDQIGIIFPRDGGVKIQKKKTIFEMMGSSGINQEIAGWKNPPQKMNEIWNQYEKCVDFQAGKIS